jgi:hypothetical protein
METLVEELIVPQNPLDGKWPWDAFYSCFISIGLPILPVIGYKNRLQGHTKPFPVQWVLWNATDWTFFASDIPTLPFPGTRHPPSPKARAPP